MPIAVDRQRGLAYGSRDLPPPSGPPAGASPHPALRACWDECGASAPHPLRPVAPRGGEGRQKKEATESKPLRVCLGEPWRLAASRAARARSASGYPTGVGSERGHAVPSLALPCAARPP